MHKRSVCILCIRAVYSFVTVELNYCAPCRIDSDSLAQITIWASAVSDFAAQRLRFLAQRKEAVS